MSDQPDRLPPHDRSAERSVLGSFLRDNHVIDEVAPLLRPDDFYADAHQKIYQSVLGLHEHRKPADLVTLADDLRDRGWLADVGAYAYLAELWDASPTSAHAFHYAQIVRRYATWRSLIYLGGTMAREGYAAAGDPEQALADFERQLFGLAEVGTAGQAHELGETLQSALERIDSRSSHGGPVSGISTGLLDLDELTAGLQDGELVIVGARPSVGKTSLAIEFALDAAVNQRLPVLFFSLEQAKEALVERMIVMQSRVDSHRVRTGRLSADDRERLIQAAPALSKAKLFIDDQGSGQTMLRIAANARRLKRRAGIRLIVVDYLQLIEPEDRKVNRYEQVGASARRLKFLAKELGCPVVCLAQVGRAAEDRARPRLSDLRESGDIEAHADVVMLLHRPGDWEDSNGQIECIVGKNRDGRTGIVDLIFLRHCMRFENCAVGHAIDEPFSSRVAP